MAEDKPFFEVLPATEMREKYDLYAENRSVIQLDAAKVPEKFRHLIPMAEKWGISDDLIREDMVDKASPQEIEELKKFIEEWDRPLDEWLAGPEAYESESSEEYTAFTCLRMAADLASC